ncbi:uncharacterized protein EDB93DRAFT_1109097 [Suillus bovinus]|uniref:uncharacterized protein n=1 Tax=Suillus bovinus TaxID=48563 RepID=UPI001B8625AE|nr:uncharacterized protein EDB93DRAFT_1109097 [Suillus bovinus]KAG2128026.1 hypothetical protein EDB93DRAFT_1109097 [Suillus bovinus]
MATMPSNPISVLQSSVPGTIKALGLSFSHADLMAMGYFGSDNTMQNSFPPAFGSSVPSFTDTSNTIGGHYDQYDMHPWNLANSHSQGWEMRSLSSFLSSLISAEHSTTTTTEQDEALPQFTCQLPILPAANAPSPIEGTQDLANTTGAGLAKSKRKLKSKPPATKVKCNPTMEPTPTIAPTNTAKPKAKPKARPVVKSGVMMETHTAVDEGNTLVHSTALNTTTVKQNPVAQCASKQIPIKSKQNDVADAIGSDGLTFVGIGKENPSVLEDVGATPKLTKCPTNSTMEGVIPAKNQLDWSLCYPKHCFKTVQVSRGSGGQSVHQENIKCSCGPARGIRAQCMVFTATAGHKTEQNRKTATEWQQWAQDNAQWEMACENMRAQEGKGMTRQGWVGIVGCIRKTEGMQQVDRGEMHHKVEGMHQKAEWMTGVKEDINFLSLAYSPVYLLHLNSLQRFDEQTAAYKLPGKIGVNLLDVAWMHAGMDPFMAAVTIDSFTDDVFDEAIREHKDKAQEAQEF